MWSIMVDRSLEETTDLMTMKSLLQGKPMT